MDAINIVSNAVSKEWPTIRKMVKKIITGASDAEVDGVTDELAAELSDVIKKCLSDQWKAQRADN